MGPVDGGRDVGAVCGVLEVQAASARAATAMAGRPASLTDPTLSLRPSGHPAEFQPPRRPGQEMSANV
jgi:hypothetical protein